MIIASIPKATAPVKLITSINFLKPKKNNPKGIKQVKNQAKFLLSPKSYHKIFFKVKERARKEVKQVITPNKKPKRIILEPIVCSNPDIASSETTREAP